MSGCERFEMQMSSWLDAELERDEQIELADHLVRCAGCRTFWAEARALGGLLEAACQDVSTATAPPPALWERIESSASEPARVVRGPWSVPPWAMRAAASVVLALGLSFALIGFGGGDGDGAITTADARFGGARMDQSRFVSLTRELLAADPVYHEAMHRVMDEVLRDGGASEASSEGFGPHVDVREDDDTTIDDRGPA